jgi:hypothetical protein
MSRRVLFHFHLFKNAGTTVDGCLRRSFGERFVSFDSDAPWHRYSADEVAAKIHEHPTAEAFSSHQVGLLPPSIDGIEVDRLLFLRHPFDRIRSVYSFERRQDSDSPGARMASKTDLPGYIRWRLENSDPTVVSEFQAARCATACTSSARRGTPRWTGPSDALLALEGLKVVGVVERLDESLCLYELELREHWPSLDLAYVSANVDPDRPALLEQRVASVRDSLPPDLWRMLEERNQGDLECHRIAMERLDAAIAETPDFAHHLQLFRARCAALAGRRPSWGSRLVSSLRLRLSPRRSSTSRP